MKKTNQLIMTGVIAGAILLPTAVGAATPTLKDAFTNFETYRVSYSKNLTASTTSEINANNKQLFEIQTKESRIDVATNSNIKAVNEEFERKIKMWKDKGLTTKDPVLQTQVQYEIKLLEAERTRKLNELASNEKLEIERLNTQRSVIAAKKDNVKKNEQENLSIISRIYSFFSPFKPTK